MASKPKDSPEPEPEPESTPEPEPSDDEDQAWARATPRLKSLFTEVLDEYFADEGVDEPEPEVQPRPVASGRPRSAAAVGGGAGNGKPGGSAIQTPRLRRQTQARPSGGSILDALLGR